MEHSLPLLCLPLVEWVEQPLYFTNDWHHYSEKGSSLQQNHGLDPLLAKFCSIEIILDVHQGG